MTTFRIRRSHNGFLALIGNCQKHSETWNTLTHAAECFAHILPRGWEYNSAHEFADLISRHYGTTNKRTAFIIEALKQCTH